MSKNELADLRAEVERLRAEDAKWQDAYMRLDTAHTRALDRAEAAERALADERAKVARVEALPDEWLGSVGVINAIFEALSEHITVPEPGSADVRPYVWCACGWRVDALGGDPGPAAIIHVSNAIHEAVAPAIREGLRTRVRAALAGPEPDEG
jgi:hypothetical protein